MLHPLTATLSADTAGPLKAGEDFEQTAKLILVGTFTWLKSAGYEESDLKAEVADEEVLEEEEGLEELEDLEEVEGLQEAEEGAEDVGRGESPENAEVAEGVEAAGVADGEQREEPEVEVFRLATPVSEFHH